ncbi:fluoride efflux transporter FluC [Lactobacillus pasteurii]|uniref:Fluoride-specific ion channel FluC n=1 Tax=Lactobacillus pasteurii DSM 23907 = CRBIP 24.76 TaxID=1423790 RepID=I7J0R9_9LACO|nr:CrcB family protein [Lactobacillus pasteurii]TDG76404.1 hypothetical protein C5L33_001163 [Lactobacillus pasteurii]CCI85872.1 Protein CrcB homolog 2 [Lactobacillus pasteurii DSM 23907 = CRBIP 24.76]
MKFWKYLSVAFFAFFGGIARMLLNSQFSFLGTFLGNVLGCFLLAFLTYFSLEFKSLPSWLVTGLGTGFVGAFTTFSTFNLDSFKLLQTSAPAAGLYFIGTILIGFLCAAIGANLGIKLGRKEWGRV